MQDLVTIGTSRTVLIMTQKALNLILSKMHIFKVIRKYLDDKFSTNQNQSKETFDVHYSKSSCIGNLKYHIKNKFFKHFKEFCKKGFNIKLVFTSFKIKNGFLYQDPIPDDLKSFFFFLSIYMHMYSLNNYINT